MHPQLQAVTAELIAAQERLHRLSKSTPDDWWSTRADPSRWSIVECVAHLNLTAKAFLPVLRRGIEEGRRMPVTAPARFRRDPTGWLLWRTSGPPVRFRSRTAASFVPSDSAPRPDTLAEFDRLQEAQIGCVREADGLPLSAIRITSPIDARVRYNLYSCLTILPRHQQRHIWQAEQVLERLRSGK
jgi:hypothetical protein